MATNKHATIRYKALDKCFRNLGKKYFIDDLISACNEAIYNYTGSDIGVQRRQVLYDINFMESEEGWSIPLERNRDNRKVYYRYSDSNFTINNQPLNESEAAQLKEALLTLNRFKGMPQFEWVEEISARLDAAFSLSNVTGQIIEFEQNQYLKGLNYISTIYQAIMYNKVLEIEYQGFNKSKPSSALYHPYFLKQYNNRWFFFALNNDLKKITNLALDRIISITESNIAYTENTTIDFTEYFEDVVGVTIDSKPQKILLQLDKSLWPYIESKPIHGSQKVKERNPDNIIIELFVVANYELKSLLFSFGERLKILKPKALAKEIKNKAIKLIDNYS